MKIGILQTGESPDELRGRFGDYPDMFKKLLDGNDFDYEVYRVFENKMPPTCEGGIDAWIITGSKFGVYEDHSWIPPLEDFVRLCAKQQKPLVGICFGHQIMAQALGGKVEKYSQGWKVGLDQYSYAEGGNHTHIAWHQDQVVEAPGDSEVIGNCPGCF